MTLEEIKEAVEAGKKVHWASTLYDVVKGPHDWFIICNANQHAIGLTHRDGVTMNGKEEDFFINEN
jgi:hypothetical protein